MAFTEIEYEADGPIRVIRFNRPDKRNCIGPVTHLELLEAWTDFRDDPSALVAIITGAGDKAFCAGGDLEAGFDLVPMTVVNAPASLARAAGPTSTNR
jgi:enoyl-CoA hydratase